MTPDISQKALEVLRAVAMIAAGGKGITISSDWGYGTATVTDSDGAHTHVGVDCWDTDAECLAAFVDGLHDLLVSHRGLSWVPALPNDEHGYEHVKLKPGPTVKVKYERIGKLAARIMAGQEPNAALSRGEAVGLKSLLCEDER